MLLGLKSIERRGILIELKATLRHLCCSIVFDASLCLVVLLNSAYHLIHLDIVVLCA